MRQVHHSGIYGAMLGACAIALVLAQVSGCGEVSREGEDREIMPREDIKQVMDAHVDGLMAISGVVGVAIGALDDGTPCIRVLLLEDTPELRGQIPGELEGHPVVIDVTGEIRAMPGEED